MERQKSIPQGGIKNNVCILGRIAEHRGKQNEIFNPDVSGLNSALRPAWRAHDGPRPGCDDFAIQYAAAVRKQSGLRCSRYARDHTGAARRAVHAVIRRDRRTVKRLNLAAGQLDPDLYALFVEGKDMKMIRPHLFSIMSGATALGWWICPRISM